MAGVSAEYYRLVEEDVAGASLKGRAPDILTVPKLQRWLSCQGARRHGKKEELVTRQNYMSYQSCLACCRMKEYNSLGLDNEILHPDGGANIDKKLARLQARGLQRFC